MLNGIKNAVNLQVEVTDMKKLILIIIALIIAALFLTSCGPSESSTLITLSTTDDTTDDDTDPPPPPPIPPQPPPPAPPEFQPTIVLVNNTGYNLSDGATTNPWLTGSIQRAGPRAYSVDADLITYDNTGAELIRVALLTTPTRIKIVNGSAHYCRQYSAAESFALGAQAQIHTEIYKDDAMTSFFAFNQWGCSDIVTADDNVWIIDESGAAHIAEGTGVLIEHIQPDRFYMHSLDTIGKTIDFNQATYGYGLNFILTADEWIIYDGLEYSENGYTWSTGTGLNEQVTAMQAFNSNPYPVTPALPFGQTPVLLGLGVYDDELYWVECNSGWLFKYEPIGDDLAQSWRLYAGNGTHALGIIKHESLMPFLDTDDGKLYFSDAGAVLSLDMATGVIINFYGSSGFVVGF